MTIYLVGVNHFEESSEQLVTNAINNVNPQIVFLELGEYRLKMLESNSSTQKFMSFLNQKINLRLRGRIINTSIASRQMIESLRTNSVIGDNDMIPALKAAENINAKVIPIDMNQHKMMNKLGRSMFSLKALSSFNFRERVRIAQSMNIGVDEATESFDNLTKLNTAMSEIMPARHRVLITDRNKYMIDNISSIINQNDEAVAIIGALHIPGMMKQLEKLGYNVEVHL